MWAEGLTMGAAACASAAVLLCVWTALRPRQVSLGDEFRVRYGVAGGAKKAVQFAAGAVGFAVAALGITGQAHLAAIAAVPGGVVAAVVMENRRVAARKELLRRQYGSVLSMLMSALQGGLSYMQALEDAVPSMPRPARDVFTAVLQRTRTGAVFVEAVEDVRKETGWDDLKSLAVAVKTYEQTGCNLVEVFGHLLESVHARESDRRYVEAVTSQAKATAQLLSLLPFFVMGVARAMAPDFIAPLFETLAGNLILGFCVAMVLFGNWVVGRMVSRVVGG